MKKATQFPFFQYGQLFSNTEVINYDKNSYLTFLNQNDGDNTVGMLTTLRSQEAKQRPSLFTNENLFQFVEFGFLLWNSQSQSLDLAAVLKDETEITNENGQRVHVDLANSYCVGLLSQKNTPYDFVLVLFRGTTDPRFTFLGFHSEQQCWIQLHTEDIVPGNRYGLLDLQNTTSKWLDSRGFASQNKFLQVTVPSYGLILYELSLSAEGILTFQKVGEVQNGYQLNENWNYQAKIDDKNKSHSVHLTSYHHDKNTHVQLFATQNRLKTFQWKQNSEGTYTPQVIHADSFTLPEEFQWFLLNSKESQKQLLVGSDLKNGFHIVKTETAGDGFTSFTRQPWDAVNAHPDVRELFQSSPDQKKRKKIILSSTDFSSSHKDKSDTNSDASLTATPTEKPTYHLRVTSLEKISDDASRVQHTDFHSDDAGNEVSLPPGHAPRDDFSNQDDASIIRTDIAVGAGIGAVALGALGALVWWFWAKGLGRGRRAVGAAVITGKMPFSHDGSPNGSPAGSPRHSPEDPLVVVTPARILKNADPSRCIPGNDLPYIEYRKTTTEVPHRDSSTTNLQDAVQIVIGSHENAWRLVSFANENHRKQEGCTGFETFLHDFLTHRRDCRTPISAAKMEELKKLSPHILSAQQAEQNALKVFVSAMFLDVEDVEDDRHQLDVDTASEVLEFLTDPYNFFPKTLSTAPDDGPNMFSITDFTPEERLVAQLLLSVFLHLEVSFPQKAALLQKVPRKMQAVLHYCFGIPFQQTDLLQIFRRDTTELYPQELKDEWTQFTSHLIPSKTSSHVFYFNDLRQLPALLQNYFFVLANRKRSVLPLNSICHFAFLVNGECIYLFPEFFKSLKMNDSTGEFDGADLPTRHPAFLSTTCTRALVRDFSSVTFNLPETMTPQERSALLCPGILFE